MNVGSVHGGLGRWVGGFMGPWVGGKVVHIYSSKEIRLHEFICNFCYADLYIIVECGIFLKKIQFPVQRGATRESTTIVEDTAAR